MVFVCSADIVEQLRAAEEDKMDVLLEIAPKTKPTSNTSLPHKLELKHKSMIDQRRLHIVTPAEYEASYGAESLQGQHRVDYERNNALRVFQDSGMVPMDPEFNKVYCTKCKKTPRCRIGTRLFRSGWARHACKEQKNQSDQPTAYALTYADMFVAVQDAEDDGSADMDTSINAAGDDDTHAAADATDGQTETAANADAEPLPLPPLPVRASRANLLLLHVPIAPFVCCSLSCRNLVEWTHKAFVPSMQNARSYEMLEYIWTHKERLNLTIPLFVCEELVNAAAVEILHPNYVNQRRHLSTVAALSDLIHSSNASHMDVCRTHLPLHKRQNIARRSPHPVCTSQAVLDLVIAYYEGGIRHGPALYADGSRRSHLVLGGRNKADLLLSIEGSDGVAINGDARYDPYSQEFVGFADAGIAEFAQHFGGLDVDEATINIDTATEFAKKFKIASEAVVFLLCTANGAFSCPVGIFYTPKTGGHAAVKARHDEMRAMYARCYECLKENKCLNQDMPCEHPPNASKDDKCIRCTELGLRCVKIDLLVWSTDRASGKQVIPVVAPS